MKSIQEFVQSLETLPEQEQTTALSQYHEKLLEEKINIEQQIHKAQQRRYTEGISADADWYHRAQSALKFKKLQIQQIQNIRGEYRRKKASYLFERTFVELAQQLLHEETYNNIRQQVWERLQRKQEENNGEVMQAPPTAFFSGESYRQYKECVMENPQKDDDDILYFLATVAWLVVAIWLAKQWQ